VLQNKPVYIFENVREAQWWTHKRPAWKCCSWWNITGHNSDRVVVVLPIDTSGHEFQLRLQRVIERAWLCVRPGGRLAVVDYRGVPQRIFRGDVRV
jgi:hypothetical protein